MIFTRFYAIFSIFTRFFARRKFSAARHLKLFCTPGYVVNRQHRPPVFLALSDKARSGRYSATKIEPPALGWTHHHSARHACWPPHVVAGKSCVSHWYACLSIELLCLTIVVGIDGMEVGAEMERKPKTKHHEITQTVPIIANIIVILNII